MTEAATSLEWRPVAVLPALRLAMTIEAGHAALVPSSEPRVSAIKDAHPVFRTFLGRFTDAFRVRVHPAVLLVHAKTPRTFLSSGSLASLRDAIAVSTVSYGRALEIIYPRGHRIGFADAFAFHPWMVDRQFEGLVAITQAMRAIHEVERFHGQPAPGVPEADLREGDVDRPLLDALLQRWRGRFSARTPAWADVALFRSLNMAHQACLMPSAAADTTLYDVGRQIALWVSAFEILVHPGPGGQANRNAVMHLLEQVDWKYRDCKARRYRVRSGKKVERRQLAAALYDRLYQARNDFLHGNPVSRATLNLRVNGRTLFHIAAPLYRLALTSFLDLRPRSFDPNLDAASLGKAMAERMEFVGYQGRHEEALLTAWFGRDRMKNLILKRRRRRLHGPAAAEEPV